MEIAEKSGLWQALHYVALNQCSAEIEAVNFVLDAFWSSNGENKPISYLASLFVPQMADKYTELYLNTKSYNDFKEIKTKLIDYANNLRKTGQLHLVLSMQRP